MMRRRWGMLMLAGALILLVALAWDGAWLLWVSEQQRHWHRSLAGALRAVVGTPDPWAATALIGVSFVYGVLHAAGPGHGKAVLSTWLLTHPSRLARGVGLAVASALVQGLMALILVGGALLLADWLPDSSQDLAVRWSERVSALVLIGVGAMALGRVVRPAQKPHHHDHHDHHHEGCGCSHSPSARQIAGAESLRTSIAIILAVGLRPCTGAVLVLALANLLGLFWAGAVAVLAMSLGTALTVASLAIVAVKGRAWISRLLPAFGASAGRWAGWGQGVGGAILLVLGVSLLLASWGPAHPLGL